MPSLYLLTVAKMVLGYNFENWAHSQWYWLLFGIAIFLYTVALLSEDTLAQITYIPL